MLPPDSDDLVRRIVARNARRARIAAVRLGDFAETRPRRHAARALQATLPRLRGESRVRFLFGPELRDWLITVEDAFALARPLEDDAELFERAAAGPHLAELLPRGRIDAGFRGRVVALGEKLLERSFLRLPALLAFLTPPRERYGPFEIDASADGEEARRDGELHIVFPVPGTLRVAPDARMELVGGGVRILQQGRGVRWRSRETIEGSAIVLARRVVHTRRGLRTGSAMPDLAGRLGRALELVRRAWPQARREIETHTIEVVPLSERGVVSYSLPTRPGTSYINVEGKSVVQLADDLLHETAHHRLHGMEELGALYRGTDDAVYYSPWRKAMRPLRGILHACFTFTYRAELFRRMLRLPARLPRAWMRKELDREVRSLQRSLPDLEDAEEQGLLTPAGGRLREAIAARVRRLARGASG